MSQSFKLSCVFLAVATVASGGTFVVCVSDDLKSEESVANDNQEKIFATEADSQDSAMHFMRRSYATSAESYHRPRQTLIDRISTMSEEELQEVINLLATVNLDEQAAGSEDGSMNTNGGRKSRRRLLPMPRIGGWASRPGGKKPVYQQN